MSRTKATRVCSVPTVARTIRLEMGPSDAATPKIVYQWRGNDGKTYSPQFITMSDAADYLLTAGLKRGWRSPRFPEQKL